MRLGLSLFLWDNKKMISVLLTIIDNASLTKFAPQKFGPISSGANELVHVLMCQNVIHIFYVFMYEVLCLEH